MDSKRADRKWGSEMWGDMQQRLLASDQEHCNYMVSRKPSRKTVLSIPFKKENRHKEQYAQVLDGLYDSV